MEKILKLYKQVGETPLECLERFRSANPDYMEAKMTYAGRLDPMAEGLLIVLVGDECKKKDDYLGMNKEYEFEVLFGVETDTYDVLGKVMGNSSYESDNVQESLQGALQKFVGKFSQTYPVYSSKSVDGIPLFELARSGKLEDVELPTKDVEIFELEMLEVRIISKKDLHEEILQRIALVKGDFRQDEIIQSWNTYFQTSSQDTLVLAKLNAKCSSGTYIRSLAFKLGKELKIPALAFSIKRTAIGDFRA